MKLTDLHENEEFDKQEEQDIKEVLSIIEQKCNPFLKQVNTSQLLYRGSLSSIVGEPYDIRNVKKNRIPTDMPLEIHSILDQWFQEKFNHKFRSNATFVTSARKIAAMYGDPYAFFPIGDFKFVWSPEVDDLFGNLQRFIRTKLNQNPEFNSLRNALANDKKQTFEYVKKFINNAKYTNKNLTNAATSNNEIMIHCDQYVVVKPYVFNSQLFETEYKKLVDKY